MKFQHISKHSYSPLGCIQPLNRFKSLTVGASFSLKLQAFRPLTILKRDFQRNYFLVNIGKFIRTSTLKNQEQPPEVLCKKRCSSKYRKNSQETFAPAITHKMSETKSSFNVKSAQREQFNFYFSRFSCSINKSFILARRLSTRLSFYVVQRVS